MDYMRMRQLKGIYMKTKPTLTYSQLKSDTLDFLIWKTIKFINRYFDGNPHSFYLTFKKWNNLNILNAKERGIVWKNMRTINQFLGIDTSLAKSITNKQLSIFSDLEKNGDIKIFNNGNLHWTNSKDEKKSQCYNKKYIPDAKVIYLIYETHKQNEYIDFDTCNFSKRLLKFITKNFKQEIDNSDIPDTTVQPIVEEPPKPAIEIKHTPLKMDFAKMRELEILRYKIANQPKEPTDDEIKELVDAIDF